MTGPTPLILVAKLLYDQNSALKAEIEGSRSVFKISFICGAANAMSADVFTCQGRRRKIQIFADVL